MTNWPLGRERMEERREVLILELPAGCGFHRQPAARAHGIKCIEVIGF